MNLLKLIFESGMEDKGLSFGFGLVMKCDMNLSSMPLVKLEGGVLGRMIWDEDSFPLSVIG
ncbi:MAG: hypothetical protein ACKEQK_00320 [Candidatus Hodgkinia cicadicola]